MGAAISKAKLHDLHPRYFQVFAQIMHLTGDVSKIFINEGQLAQRALERFEQAGIRARHPTAVDRCGLLGGNFPARFKTTKVIEAHDIASLNRSEEHTSELQSLRHLVCR